MTVNELIKTLQNLKPELKEKEVKIFREAGELWIATEVKLVLKDPYNVWDRSKNNVDYIVIL